MFNVPITDPEESFWCAPVTGEGEEKKKETEGKREERKERKRDKRRSSSALQASVFNLSDLKER